MGDFVFSKAKWGSQILMLEGFSILCVGVLFVLFLGQSQKATQGVPLLNGEELIRHPAKSVAPQKLGAKATEGKHRGMVGLFFPRSPISPHVVQR